ncbi:hypothetical protein [Domibacillus enclensis]|uniref:GRAM domain-containing protein n=1 Tax=Domibacillus enclensis TaxID=1017273 RepID=A0A1N6NDL4_9BACI|nr:hypothetical protein [Domibacillus enclensis]OXS80013.1 hypothetical protein B1B05_00570 [Domibacillus enclensis]SIP90175.1 hypothetical protein SAMN05443094_101116 [Domibacillus enclensis]
MMTIFTDGQAEAEITESSYCWKKNSVKVEDGYLKSTGMVTHTRIPLKHIDTVVYSYNPKKPAIVPVLKIIGKGTVLCEMEISAEHIEAVQDWMLNVIES